MGPSLEPPSVGRKLDKQRKTSLSFHVRFLRKGVTYAQRIGTPLSGHNLPPPWVACQRNPQKPGIGVAPWTPSARHQVPHHWPNNPPLRCSCAVASEEHLLA